MHDKEKCPAMPAPDFRGSTQVHWNVTAIFNAAGGPEGLIELLKSYGYKPPTLNTARSWRARRRLPNPYIPMVLVALLKSGKAQLSEILRAEKVAA